jgi:hypothetical protein
MVIGFNHNFCYKGRSYHVQTEDSGLKSPHITTLLYKGGTILASKKTSYAHITTADDLDKKVKDLMKEQHKEMLRRLKDGEFDAIIEEIAPDATIPRSPASEKTAGYAFRMPNKKDPSPLPPSSKPAERQPVHNEEHQDRTQKSGLDKGRNG